MPLYVLYIHDDRYTVPAMRTAEAPENTAAQATAAQILNESPHYRAVEVWLDDNLVARLDR
ncbi:MAG TPA: hypothetical protein VG943_05825 [Caulobacterales bacterium]|nr:hypothetical protein [Caulobacterales bacterium]